MSRPDPIDTTIEVETPPAPSGVGSPIAPAGDEWRARLDRVFRDHGRAIHARAVRLVGKTRAEDLVGDTMLSVVSGFGRHLDRLTPPDTDAGMAGYVFKSLKNRRVNVLRRAKDEETLFVDPGREDREVEDDGGLAVDMMWLDGEVDHGIADAAVSGRTPLGLAAQVAAEEHFDVMEMEELITVVMELLPPKQQAVIQHLHLDGMSRNETAEKLGVSVRTVDAHLQAAYARMRDYALDLIPDLESDRVAASLHSLSMRHEAKCDRRADRRLCREMNASESGGDGAKVA